MQSGVVRIEHREPTFRYEAAFAAESGQVEVKYELQTDGREIVAAQGGITTVSRLRWDDDALVATWQIQLPDSEMTISFRHELIENGRRLRAVEELRANGRDQDNVWLFERR